MKVLLTFFFAIQLCGVFSQETDSGKIYSVSEVQTLPTGPGDTSATEYLSQKMRTIKWNGAEPFTGKIYIEIVIETNGTVSETKVKGNCEQSLKDEIIQVLERMPAWKAGIQNGHPVRTRYMIPVNICFR